MAFFLLKTFAVALLLLFVLLFPSASPFKHHHSSDPHNGHHSSANAYRHGPNHSHSSPQGHHSRQQQDAEERAAPPNAGPSCSCGGCSAGGAHGMPAHGIPLFLFPDNVMRPVDVVLRSENALHRDNDDLARHLFHLLAHQFTRKWFIVGVGTIPAKSARGPRLWALQGMDVLNGSVPLQAPPAGHGFPFWDGRRFQRENGSQLWYFVCAIEPTTTSKATEGSTRQSLAKCLSKKRCSPLDDLASICADDHRPLGMAVQFGQNSAMSIFASEPLAMGTETMALAKEATECLENEGEEKRGEQQHILVVAAPEGEKE